MTTNQPTANRMTIVQDDDDDDDGNDNGEIFSPILTFVHDDVKITG